MKKIIITYGLISAGISAIMWTVIALFMKSGNFSHGMIIGYTSMLLSIFVIYFAMKNYRDNYGGGRITFGKALLIGLFISIIFAVCYVITWMIIRQTLLPDFADNYIAYEINQLKKLNLSPDAMNKKVAELQQMKSIFSNPWKEASMVFIEPWPVAILVTLISAIIVSRKKKEKVVVA
jgi:hypothetical protein